MIKYKQHITYDEHFNITELIEIDSNGNTNTIHFDYESEPPYHMKYETHSDGTCYGYIQRKISDPSNKENFKIYVSRCLVISIYKNQCLADDAINIYSTKH